MKVGRPIRAGAVVSKSAKILSANPLILLPQLLLLVLTLVGDVLQPSSIFSPLRVIISIISFVVSVIVSGAYPSMVKAVIEGGKFSVTEALGKAYHRFWDILLAGIMVGLFVALGPIAVVVPGIILATWYAYTIPAIMLEEKGATVGMAASKAFGRDKKGDTFLIFVAILIGAVVISVVDSLLSLASPALGELVYAILLVPFGAWISVILAYTYLTCGPLSVPAATGTEGYGIAPPASTQPPVQANVSVGSPGSFCQYCGSPVPAGSKFCTSCGKPV